MDDKSFDAMVKANNLQVLYRGESGQEAADRFMNDELSHIGAGNYGSGYYFSTRKSDAIGYAQSKSKFSGNGKLETMVLSPTARAIKHSDLVNLMSKASPKFLKALGIAGRSDNSGYTNAGEMQFAAKLGYNVIAVDSGWGNTYCFAIDRSAFIVRKSLETY